MGKLGWFMSGTQTLTSPPREGEPAGTADQDKEVMSKRCIFKSTNLKKEKKQQQPQIIYTSKSSNFTPVKAQKSYLRAPFLPENNNNNNNNDKKHVEMHTCITTRRKKTCNFFPPPELNNFFYFIFLFFTPFETQKF